MKESIIDSVDRPDIDALKMLLFETTRSLNDDGNKQININEEEEPIL